MAKAIEMGKTSAVGSFHLLLGVAGSTIIMAIGTIVLGMLLPAEGVGLYGMAMIPASIINFFRDWGINTAITKQIAALRETNKHAEIHDVIVSGVIFEIISGIVLSLVCFTLAWPIAHIISPQNAEALSIYISIMSLSIFAGAIAAAAGGVFVGYERMKLNSFTQISQAIIKTALGPLLIIIGFGVLGAVIAAMVSILAGGTIAILLTFYVLFRPLRKYKTGKCDIKQTLKPMLKYGLPLTASTIATGVLPQVFSFVMAVYAGTWMMGNYFTAANFSVLLTFVSIPISTALFPVFAKLQPQKEPQLLKTVFAFSVKYTALLLVPATLILITLATPIVHTLFPLDGIFQALFIAGAQPKFPFAPLFLALSVGVNLFVLCGNVSLGTFQMGIGETTQILKQSVLSLVTGLPLAYFLVAYASSLGGSDVQLSATYAVIGGLAGSLIASMPGMIWGLIWSWKKYHVKADFRVSGKIFASALLASLASFVVINLLNLPYVIILIIGAAIFVAVYLTAAPLFGAINRMDIENLRAMFSGLGIVSRLITMILSAMSKLCHGSTEPQNSINLSSSALDSQKP